MELFLCNQFFNYMVFLQVVSVNLKMDQMTGRSRGFAFVVFQDVDTLSKVLAEEHAIKGKNHALKKYDRFALNTH